MRWRCRLLATGEVSHGGQRYGISAAFSFLPRHQRPDGFPSHVLQARCDHRARHSLVEERLSHAGEVHRLSDVTVVPAADTRRWTENIQCARRQLIAHRDDHVWPLFVEDRFQEAARFLSRVSGGDRDGHGIPPAPFSLDGVPISCEAGVRDRKANLRRQPVRESTPPLAVERMREEQRPLGAGEHVPGRDPGRITVVDRNELDAVHPWPALDRCRTPSRGDGVQNRVAHFGRPQDEAVDGSLTHPCDIVFITGAGDEDKSQSIFDAHTRDTGKEASSLRILECVTQVFPENHPEIPRRTSTQGPRDRIRPGVAKARSRRQNPLTRALCYAVRASVRIAHGHRRDAGLCRDLTHGHPLAVHMATLSVYRYTMRFRLGPYFAFAAFGIFWGTWGATLPALREAGGLTTAELGSALLCVGAGALPAMLFTGAAIDHFGVRITGLFLLLLSASGVLLAWSARDPLSISIGMLLVGAASGAADVGANALAALGEARSTRRVITLGHAVFSLFVVASSLGAGALRDAGQDVLVIFAAAGLASAAAGTMVLAFSDGRSRSATDAPSATQIPIKLAWPLVAIGLVGALGFAAENAHQSWSAIFLEDELQSGAGVAAIAPATFATAAAITRFTAGASNRVPASVLLLGGATTAFIGTVVVAAATSVPVALVGLAVAAVGTSLLYPTLVSTSLQGVSDEHRGRATSMIATTSYLGFVVGPVFVGVLAGAVGLRGAMIGVAVLAVAFAVAAPPVTRILSKSRDIDAVPATRES